VQYVDWLTDMVSLNWGDSLATGQPVLPLVVDGAARMAIYVLLALAVAVIVGISVGLYAALHPEGRLASVGPGIVYLAYGVLDPRIDTVRR